MDVVGRGWQWFSKLILVALVVRVMRGEANPRPLPRRASAPPTKGWGRPLGRWVRYTAEPAVMLLVCAAGFYVGMRFLPRPDDDPPLPPRLQVTLPGYIDDGNGWWAFNGLSWTEVHYNPRQPAPKLAPHNIRVGIEVNFAKQDMGYWESIKQQDSRIELEVDLPDTTKVVSGCEGLNSIYGLKNYNPSIKTGCYLKQRDRKDPRAALRTKQYLQVVGVVRAGNTGIDFYFDVTGVDGLTLLTNRTRAAARFPSAGPHTKFPPMPRTFPPPPWSVAVVDDIPEVGKFTWAPRPADEAEDAVGWEQKSDNANASPITGVREDVIRADSHNEFLSGIAFGVGGAAFIGFVQSVFTGCRERRPKNHASPP